MTEKQQEKWDLGRFFRTLSYFRTIPFVGTINLPYVNRQVATKSNNNDVILVVGATGGVGKRVVKSLLKKGYKVRAIARNSNSAKTMLGENKNLEIMEADLTIPQTLTPEITNNLRGVICCTGTRVQPKEGDTPTREKYYQGIKFYLPEVVDIPEQVEYIGIKNLVQSVTQAAENRTIFDFTKPTEDLKNIWGALDDVVMGGVSESNIKLGYDSARFFGNVSTANSGGFASVRTRNFEPSLNLSSYEGIQLRVKGDGKRYKFIIRCEERWDGIGYCYSFDTVYNIWITVNIPFDQLIPVFRAKTIKNGQPFDQSKVTSVQLMLSKFEYDGALNPKFSPGIFELEIESIKAYGGHEFPRFISVSSAGVTRPGRPGINLAEEPPAVRLNDQLGGILTWKLRGEDVIRASNLPHTIIRPCALTEEPGGKALILEQGDNIKGKVSRDDIAELCVTALESYKAINTTFEVKESAQGTEIKESNSLFSQLEYD